MASDADLFVAWCEGDQWSGATLFDRHFAAVSRFFRNKVSDDFEDLVQQTFTACVEARDRFRLDSSFRTFLFAIANNILRNYYRRRRRDRLEFTEVSAYDLQPGPSTIIAKVREQKLLLEALRHIPLEHQVILELYYWEGLTAKGIGEVIDQSEHTVRNRLRRGKELLRRHMETLASDADELESTWGGLERWARDVYKEVG
ncbi:ECF RNA polymerase sigma factor SigR [Enhygromyxa salina]|uniref:ECF RNA polymerase sigma factor SigR n=1 Tax=Enhygromyxa salina TaxID=215803 RepID=A0A2S9YIA7_9BACT|nr:sigma-70 family RNA polymerase sigma factor [Enhygromyxa salina]PRQ04746.1 ECF RNA polymerase sigma factor SigR [Enhygromyxa salina]